MKRLDDSYLQQFIGQQFGRLTVLSYDGYYAKNRKRKRHFFKCECSCGNIKYVTLDELRSGDTKSCGCLQKEIAAKSAYETSFKYGRKSSPYYSVYNAMINRCYNVENSNYKYYGAKGIKVCDEWLNDPFVFFKWAEDNNLNGRDISIDRIDVYGDYTPDNCRPADVILQHNNTTRNKYITYNNKTQTLSEWCRELNMSYGNVKNKLNRGYKFEDIIMDIKSKE